MSQLRPQRTRISTVFNMPESATDSTESVDQPAIVQPNGGIPTPSAVATPSEEVNHPTDEEVAANSGALDVPGLEMIGPIPTLWKVGLCPELNRGGIFQSGRVIYFALQAGKKHPNPIIKPDYYPISNPITAVYYTYIHVDNSNFTSYTIGIMYTKRVLFCTYPDVNFDFFTSHHHLGIFDDGATAILYGNSMENTVFQWAKNCH